MQCRPGKDALQGEAMAPDPCQAQSGFQTASTANSPTPLPVDIAESTHLLQSPRQAAFCSRWLDASTDSEDGDEGHGRSCQASLNLAFHLIIQDRVILLKTSQLEFDAPNLLTRALNGDPAVQGDIEITLNASGTHLRQKTRSPAIFESLLRPYLSGSPILPLSKKAVSVLLPCCQQEEDPLAVLCGEAEFWGFKRLEERILQEKNESASDANTESGRNLVQPALHPKLQAASQEKEEVEEESENIPSLLKRPSELLTAFQRDLIRRYRASCEKVLAWLLAIRECPKLAKPSNSTYLETLGWQPGTMFYNKGPVVHRSSLMSDDLVQSAEDANYAHKIEFVIKTEDHRDIIQRFNRQSALTMSTEDFQLIFTQCDKGSSFHTCMQNKFGRHGLRILYTEGLMPSSVPGSALWQEF